jgi:hypothetical protein
MVFTRIIERKFIEGISGTGHTYNAGPVKKNYEIVPKTFLCSESRFAQHLLENVFLLVQVSICSHVGS